MFELIQGALSTGGDELIKKVNGVFLFKVAGDGGKVGSWVVDAKNNGGSVRIAKDGTAVFTFNSLLVLQLFTFILKR